MHLVFAHCLFSQKLCCCCDIHKLRNIPMLGKENAGQANAGQAQKVCRFGLNYVPFKC
jgi:hypothetical protein